MHDIFSVLSDAIRQRDEITCVMAGTPITLCPHVLYESLHGRGFWVGGVSTHSKIPVYIPLCQTRDIEATGRTFQPDPHFNLDDPRYDNAVAIIESPWRRSHKPALHNVRRDDRYRLRRFKQALIATLGTSAKA